MSSIESQSPSTSSPQEQLAKEIVRKARQNNLLAIKAKQSIQRNMESQDEAIRRDYAVMERLVYGDGGEGGAGGTLTAEAEAQEESDSEDPEMEGLEDEGIQIGDIAGDVTINLPPKSNSTKPKASSPPPTKTEPKVEPEPEKPKSTGNGEIPELLKKAVLIAAAMGGGGLGITTGAMAVNAMLDPPAATSPGEDTIGVLETDKDKKAEEEATPKD